MKLTFKSNFIILNLLITIIIIITMKDLNLIIIIIFITTKDLNLLLITIIIIMINLILI